MTIRVRVLPYPFGAFGTASQVNPDKDCPVGGDWGTWCDCVYGAGTDLNRKCRNWFPSAPWTDVGAFARGLPKSGNIVEALVTGVGQNVIANITGKPTPEQEKQMREQVAAAEAAAKAQPQVTEHPQSLMGVPKTIAIVGGGALGLGALLLLLSSLKKKGKTNGS